MTSCTDCGKLYVFKTKDGLCGMCSLLTEVDAGRMEASLAAVSLPFSLAGDASADVVLYL